MEILIIIICLVILAETTFLSFRKVKIQRSGKRKIYVDTSALIDGRILNVARTGFIEGDFIVLKSVLLELQLLADSKDSERRNIARRGLENVSELERIVEINTEVIEDTTGKDKVDEALLHIAKENGGAILTTDFNLIKVAKAEKIQTLNVNDLALALKTDFNPGEKVLLKITGKGSNEGQGVGHLGDGTMVVVEGASRKVGKSITVELLRIHETSSGKMVFGKVVKN